MLKYHNKSVKYKRFSHNKTIIKLNSNKFCDHLQFQILTPIPLKIGLYFKYMYIKLHYNFHPKNPLDNNKTGFTFLMLCLYFIVIEGEKEPIAYYSIFTIHITLKIF